MVGLSHSSDLMTEPSGEQKEDTLCGDKNQTGGSVGSLVPRESGSQKSTFHSKQSLPADLSLSLDVSDHRRKKAPLLLPGSPAVPTQAPLGCVMPGRYLTRAHCGGGPLLHASCLTSNKPAGLSESPLLSVPVWLLWL